MTTSHGGISTKLSWTPQPYELHARIQTKWPDLVSVMEESECCYYKDAQAQQEWEQHGLTATNVDLRLHALWNTEGECWIVVGTSHNEVANFVKAWSQPILFGDLFDVFDLDTGQPLRAVTVIKVTKRSFHTSDGVRWSLAGKTPWAQHNVNLKAIKKTPN